MKLKCLNSCSDGNGYLLDGKTECLVIEQGMPMKLTKILLDFDVKRIVGGIQSHKHQDHSRYEKDYIKNGVRIFHPADGHLVERFGGFTVQAFPLVHDVPCYGFLIRHPECGPIVFCTDTEYVPVTFRGIKPETLMIECNYQTKYLPEGLPKNDRQYLTHMEAGTTIRCIEANKTDALKHVILLHLSKVACDPDEVVAEVRRVVGENVTVDYAREGLRIEL